MKIFKKENYENLIPQLDLTLEEICETIETFQLTFIQIKNKLVEWELDLPMFVPSFYDFIINEKKIPSQTQFYENYLKLNTSYFSNNNFDEEIMVAIKARVFRTYPSLVRDIHFAKFLFGKFKKSIVIYNQRLDIEEGIDLMIINNDKHYAINLYTATSRGFLGRKKKKYRHKDFDNVEYIEVPVDFKGSVKCGDFFLYGTKEMNLVITKLLEKK